MLSFRTQASEHVKSLCNAVRTIKNNTLAMESLKSTAKDILAKVRCHSSGANIDEMYKNFMQDIYYMDLKVDTFLSLEEQSEIRNYLNYNFDNSNLSKGDFHIIC